MSQHPSKASFWTIGISGLFGIFLGAGGMFFSSQQANTAENHYFMELDKLRHSIYLESSLSFEEKLAALKQLKEVMNRGYQFVFDENITQDIASISSSIWNINQASQASDLAAAEARIIEQKKLFDAAQKRKELAVKTNPLLYLDCGAGANQICP